MKKRTIILSIATILVTLTGLSIGLYFLFNQPLKSNWNYEISDAIIVPDIAAVPRYPFTPDGHICVLPDGSGNWMMFWAGDESYRTIGATPYPENHTLLSPPTPVIGGKPDEESWHNGGLWLYSVHRISGNNLVGFVHAEDHWYPQNVEGIAWKSIGVTYSYNNGLNWTESEQIITSWLLKPDTPEWGGAGDFQVIWDANNTRWVCFYQERTYTNGPIKLHMAISTDPLGSPGTWKKWNGEEFIVEGLGGRGKPIKVLSNYPGSNPSVHWNTFVNEWIMVWHTHKGIIYISGSKNLIQWEKPRQLVSTGSTRKAWFATIIGFLGDQSADQYATLYYADLTADLTSRFFYRRFITFMY